MRRKSFEDLRCSVAQTLEVVGEWWTLLIVRDLFLGVRRFDAIQERLGIARNVLADRLDHLVERGIVERRPYQEHPVRHDYVLTEKGRALWPVIEAMRTWGDDWEAPDGPPLELVHRAAVGTRPMRCRPAHTAASGCRPGTCVRLPVRALMRTARWCRPPAEPRRAAHRRDRAGRGRTTVGGPPGRVGRSVR